MFKKIQTSIIELRQLNIQLHESKLEIWKYGNNVPPFWSVPKALPSLGQECMGQILGICVNRGLDYLLDLNVDEFN
jgi:hypothetical protein